MADEKKPNTIAWKGGKPTRVKAGEGPAAFGKVVQRSVNDSNLRTAKAASKKAKKKQTKKN